MLRFLFLAIALCFALPAHAQTNGVSKSKNTGSRSGACDSQTRPAQYAIPLAVQDTLQRIAAALETANAPKDISREDARAERDVRAQEEIARLGPKMFELGIAEIILTGIGVLLLYLTLAESRSTARKTAEFNARQIAIAGAQTDIQTAQKEIARQQYLASNRSRLRVRLVKIRPLLEGGQVHVEFEITNVGTFAATVTGIKVTVNFRGVIESGTSVEPLWTGSVPVPQQVIEAGDTVPVSHPTAIIYKKWSMGPGIWWSPRNNIHITGVITYADDAKAIRRTGFYRVSTDDTNRFVRLSSADINADYEYED